MIYYILGSMGSGKTLFSTLYAVEYAKRNPNNKIYANYRIKNIKNFIYTPFGFLPFSELDNALIILDDILALKDQIEGFLKLIVNASRKLNLDILLTAQYYAFIPKSIRTLGILICPNYIKKYDIILVKKEIEPDTRAFKIFIYKEAVKTAKDFYDTNEIVLYPNEDDYCKEILKISKKEEDIERNLSFFTTSQERRKKMKKLIEKIKSN